MRDLYVNNFRPFLKKHNDPGDLACRTHLCRRRLPMPSAIGDLRWNAQSGVQVVLCIDVVVASPTKIWRWKALEMGRTVSFFLNQKVPTSRIPIPKIWGGGQQKRSFDVPIKRETFAFLEVQVDKNLPLGEKVWQIGGWDDVTGKLILHAGCEASVSFPSESFRAWNFSLVLGEHQEIGDNWRIHVCNPRKLSPPVVQ